MTDWGAFLEGAVQAGEDEARRRRHDGYTVDAARHAAIYAVLGNMLGAEAGLQVLDRLQSAAESVPDAEAPEGVFTGHGPWVTVTEQSDDGELYSAVCTCGWSSQLRKLRHAARADLQLHLAEAA